jgi:hypothetical protein
VQCSGRLRGSEDSATQETEGEYDEPGVSCRHCSAHLSAAPILKHPDQEEEAEGSVPVTVLKDVPLDFRARGWHDRLGVRNGRRTGVRWADSGAHTSHAGGYEQ